MNISGAVIVVTGASAGIGEATARLASQAGARLVLLARREYRIQKLAKELGNAIAIACDVTDASQIANAIGLAVDEFGRIDVLVNNAGQGLQAAIGEIKPDDFREILNLNLVAPLMMIQAVLPHMLQQGAGSIVNVSSGITYAPLPCTAAYNSSKAGLNMLSSVARAELAGSNIAVSTMFPSITSTEFVDAIKAGKQAAEHINANSGLDVHEPEEVAEKIIELICTGNEKADTVPPEFGGTYVR